MTLNCHRFFSLLISTLARSVETSLFSLRISVSLQLNLSRLNIIFHIDKNVDLAAIQIGPDLRLYEYLLLPKAYFITSTILKEKNIREGSTAFFAGLFVY